IREEIEHMYCKHYEVPCTRIPKPDKSFLHHLLMTLKAGRPKDFCGELWVSPYTFDCLVAKISVDPVFANNSETALQTPVEEQLAVALYCFGHDENAAGLQSTACWAGVGKGTIHLFTRRVMVAVLWPEFMQEAVRYPTPEEKEEAKKWVAKCSCKVWRRGWCFVDGTLVPLSKHPFWFGESYFNWKCQYLLSFQIVSLPNLHIIDFTYGHTGSTHDSMAWEQTKLVQSHNKLLKEGEWVWADSAYPVHLTSVL
ncbi:hypothetical protein L208DRAFT_1268176, partial [Tricholoma matsutake]